MKKRKRLVAAQLVTICLICLAEASAQTAPVCTSFTVVTQDKLNNIKEGLSADDAKWFREKIEKKYPGACYVDPTPTASTVFYITTTPDTYNGTRIVNQTSTQATPVRGTITDQDGNVSQVSGTEQTTSTSSTAVPYSFEYGIFTLSVETRRSDGTFEIVQTFQQKGIYNTLYGIPLGGRGHHPAHAVIEDAAKWVNGGGLSDQRQSSLAPGHTLPNTLTFDESTAVPIAHASATLQELQSKAQTGDAAAQFNLGLDYDRRKDYAQAGVWYRKAAEQGLAEGQSILGTLYRDGQGVPQDYAQAAAWYRKAAEQGNSDAQTNLGILYFNGQGVPQDYTQAAIWYRKAAEQGDAAAETNLGIFYQKGHSVPQDYSQAAAWYRKAAEQNDPSAQLCLGMLYAAGQGVPLDYVESYFWLDLAASGNQKGVKQEDVTRERDLAASHLTPADLSQAQARASKWFAEHTVSK